MVTNDHFVRYKKEIHRAAEKVLGILNLHNLRVDVSYPAMDINGNEKWQVDFFDSDGHQRGETSFVREPGADESWYIETIKSKLKIN